MAAGSGPPRTTRSGKLKAEAEALRTEEGWKWVDAALDFPYGHTSGLRRFYGERAQLSEAELERYDQLKDEYDRLDADYAASDEQFDETEARLEELGNKLDHLNDRPYVFDPEEVARGGTFISLGAGGDLRIERGFVRPGDEPVVESGEDGDDLSRSAFYDVAASSGGGVSINGSPVDAELVEDEDDKLRPLSDRLVEDLTAARTIAMRNALANDPVMAFIAALHVLVLKTFFTYGSDSCLELTLQSASFSQTPGLADTVWAKEIDRRHESWGQDLPKNAGNVWTWLLAIDEVSRQALFAHCVSLSLNATVQQWNRRPASIAHAGDLARSIGFDMVDAGWTPTVDSYLGRVTKAHIMQAVREAKGDQSVELIAHLKKSDMAREAERLLTGSGWLPEQLRLTVDDAPAEHAIETEGDVALPAYLHDGADTESTDDTPEAEDYQHLDAAE